MNQYESVHYENMRQAIGKLFVEGLSSRVYCPVSCKTNGVIDPVKVSDEFVIPQKWIKIVSKNLLVLEKPCPIK